MAQRNIDELKVSLREALYLDLDDYALEERDGEVVSTFIGLGLKSAFQPILDFHTGKPLGYEGLLRPYIGPQTVAPEFAFSFADTSGRLVKLDRVARALHMLNYLNLPEDKGLLFLNVHPKLLTSINAHGKVFERILHAHSVPTFQVVIEILESAVEDEKALQEAITNYRDRGYKIAIDDFGSKHSNLDRLWRFSPDFVKFDLNIVQEAGRNPKVNRILPKLVEIVHELGAQTIIEGVETEIHYQLALDAGASLLQGYWLGKPDSASNWKNSKQQPSLSLVA